ncbi:GNAT family N-acetyltransferase [Cellulomonas soli]
MSDAPEYLVREPDDYSSGFDTFTCGDPTLDAWLHDSALRAHEAGSTRVRLLWHLDSASLVGYYAICPTEVRRAELPLSSKVRAAMSAVPGFMLAKLAIASHAQGRGLGRDLLLDALEHICDASDLAGGRIIVVDPIDDGATAFYARSGFRAVDGHTRMYLLVQDAKASLALA